VGLPVCQGPQAEKLAPAGSPFFNEVMKFLAKGEIGRNNHAQEPSRLAGEPSIEERLDHIIS
jgi:hypothetical protein